MYACRNVIGARMPSFTSVWCWVLPQTCAATAIGLAPAARRFVRDVSVPWSGSVPRFSLTSVVTKASRPLPNPDWRTGAATTVIGTSCSSLSVPLALSLTWTVIV